MLVINRHKLQTDRQTDRQTDGRTDGPRYEITLCILVIGTVRGQGLSNCRVSVRPYVRLSHPAAARRCCGFTAVGPAARRCRPIAAQPAVSSIRAAARRAAANAGSATLSLQANRRRLHGFDTEANARS